jgi:hypothetical protein
MADPDWTDPCAVLAWMRPQFYKVQAGLQEIRILYAGNDTHYGLANLPALQSLMRQLESECAAKQGATANRRRPIIAG